MNCPFTRRMRNAFVVLAGLGMLATCGNLLGKEPPSAKPTAPKVDAPAAGVLKGDKEPLENPFPNRFPATDLEGGTGWLNTSGPISLKDLRGKVVLLDFWTFCCINCMHVLPDLKYLEKKYGKEIVVIGVHSAKFDNEKDAENIKKAILRYEIEHPVVNDSQMLIWRKYRINSWPSLVLIDPEGFYCGYVSGEGNREVLDTIIERVIAYHREKKTLDETPVRFDLERHRQPATPLRFPGKLLADAEHDRLFISDSNHNRIVVTSLKGELREVIGEWGIGRKDGSYQDARFDHPQGMCLVGETLYVADTENHLLRAVNLQKKTVTTLAGTGSQARGRGDGGKLLATDLNSPWDLVQLHGNLFIAMAGPHQLWSHKIGSDSIQPYAGSGREDILNGTLQQAAFAQPSGIATDGQNLYVVDSEGSAVRKVTTTPKVDLDVPKGKVTTIVGTYDLPQGRSLFEFGDVDGEAKTVRLQHPLGIAFHEGKLYVADSYNHKLKVVDPEKRNSHTWLGTGKAGIDLKAGQLAEPAGIAIAQGRMYVADTNNHRVLTIDLETKAVSEFAIAGLTPPGPALAEDASPADAKSISVISQQVATSQPLTFHFQPVLPNGFKINVDFPSRFAVSGTQAAKIVTVSPAGERLPAVWKEQEKRFEVTLPWAAPVQKGTVELSLSYGFCQNGGEGLCRVQTIRWSIPLEPSADAKSATIALPAK